MMEYPRRMRLLTLAVLLGFLAQSSTATAQETGEGASHFAAGRAALLAHHNEEALREFSAAFVITHEPSLLFNLGIVYEDSGRYPEALTHYRRYLEAVPAAVNRSDVERRIRLLEST